MICPNCEYEYLEGITVCPDCGEKLIPLEDFKGHMVEPSDWVTVYDCSETYIADMIKANLKGAGIESLVLIQKDSSFPVAGDLAVIRVKVLKSDEAEARKIIDDIESHSDSSDNLDE